MSRFRRASLGAGFGYSPGEQPADADGWLKLNTNESPLPPSSHVAAAVAAAAAGPARYPDPLAEPLRTALARYHGVDRTHVFVANGADQVLDCLYRAFASPGDTVVRTDPGYSLLPVLAALFSARDVAVSLAPDGALPAGFATETGVLRVIVNPNSPTGRWIEPTELETSIARSCWDRCDRRGLLRLRSRVMRRPTAFAPELGDRPDPVEVARPRGAEGWIRARALPMSSTTSSR